MGALSLNGGGGADGAGDDAAADLPYLMDELDHKSVVCVHSFLGNLYFYATRRSDEFRQHMLADTLLIPRLILPYLDRCVAHALVLNQRARAFHKVARRGAAWRGAARLVSSRLVSSRLVEARAHNNNNSTRGTTGCCGA